MSAMTRLRWPPWLSSGFSCEPLAGLASRLPAYSPPSTLPRGDLPQQKSDHTLNLHIKNLPELPQ